MLYYSINDKMYNNKTTDQQGSDKQERRHQREEEFCETGYPIVNEKYRKIGITTIHIMGCRNVLVDNTGGLQISLTGKSMKAVSSSYTLYLGDA